MSRAQRPPRVLELVDSKRSPLVPLGLVDSSRNDLTGLPQPQQVFFSNSDISDGPCFEDDESVGDRYEMMSVTVVIYGLAGIMCEKDEEYAKRRPTLGAPKSISSKISVPSSRVTGSTLSSTMSPSMMGGDRHLSEYVGAPTTAVVSYRKNKYSSQTALETYLPSVPIGIPSSSTNGQKQRYQAFWPVEQSSAAQDTSALARSSVVVTRPMTKENLTAGDAIGSKYVHERLELQIKMSRGTELLNLGTATIIISGEEQEGERLMIVPIKPMVLQKKRSKKRVRAKPNQYGYFSGDLTRKFYIDGSSTLKVGVRVTPRQTSVSTGKLGENSENELRKYLHSGGLKNMVQQLGTLKMGEAIATEGDYPVGRAQHQDELVDANKEVSQSFFQNLLSCGALWNTGKNNLFSTTEDVPVEIHAFQYNGPLGIGSNISSVSESTDGSDGSCETSEESDDIEDLDLDAELDNFRMATAFRRFV